MRLPLIALSMALWLLATTAAARAQVVVDPDSPSAKEYAIPLENERRQADPEAAPQDGVTQGERSSPLFGAGIEKPDAGEQRKKRKDRDPPKDDEQREPSQDGDIDAGDDKPAVVRAAAADPGAPGGGIGTGLAIGGVALAVVALGAGAGFALRRRA